MITENHMGVGKWEVNLRPDTPGQILDRLTFFGHIVITPAWVAPQSFATVTDLIALSLYTAPKFQHSGRRTRLGGYGPAVWLGMNSGGYSRLRTSDITDTDSFEDHLREFVLTETGDKLNGITEGSIYTGGAIPLTIHEYADTPLDVLNYLCEYLEIEWRINSDLSLDCRAASTFWPSPSAVLTPWWGGRDLGQVGHLTTFDVGEDAEGYANGLAAQADSGSSSFDDTFSETVYGLDGVKITRMVDLGRVAGAGDAIEAAAYVAAVTDSVLRQYRQHARVRLVDAYAPRVELEPGCTVAVYDPTQGLYDLATTPIQYRGHIIYPAHLRVEAITWPVQSGMGVWFIDSTSGLSVTDLTAYVEWESGDAALDVGARPLPALVLA